MAEEEVVTQETEQTEGSKPDYVQDKFWNKDLNEINIEENFDYKTISTID